ANFAQLNVKLCLGHPQLYLCLYVHIIATTITTIGILCTPIVIDDHMYTVVSAIMIVVSIIHTL
ncbi:hypothetical protein GBAR_LOCUS13382, partial [Geodia barretti]